MIPTSVRCPACKNKIIKSRDGQTVVMMDGMVIQKSGEVSGKCKDCRQRVTLSSVAIDSLRSAVLLSRPQEN